MDRGLKKAFSGVEIQRGTRSIHGRTERVPYAFDLLWKYYPNPIRCRDPCVWGSNIRCTYEFGPIGRTNQEKE